MRNNYVSLHAIYNVQESRSVRVFQPDDIVTGDRTSTICSRSIWTRCRTTGKRSVVGTRAYDAPDARDQAVPHNTSSAKDSRSRKEDACRKCSRPLWSGAFGIKLFHFVRTGDHALRCRRFSRKGGTLNLILSVPERKDSRLY